MADQTTLVGAKDGPKPGRPPGSPNKTTRILKEALLLAAERAGVKIAKLDAENADAGLVEFLTWAAEHEPRAFLSLLGRVLPMQVTGEDGGPVQVSGMVVRFVKAEAPVELLTADE